MPWPTRASASAEAGGGPAAPPGVLARLRRRPLARVALVVLALLVSSAVYAPWIASDLPYHLRGVDLRAYESARRTLEPVAGALRGLLQQPPGDGERAAWLARVRAEGGALALRLETMARWSQPVQRARLEEHGDALRRAVAALDDAPTAAQLADRGAALGAAADAASEEARGLVARHPPERGQGVALAARTSWPLLAALSPLDLGASVLWTLVLAWGLVRRLPRGARVALLLGLPCAATLAAFALGTGATARGGVGLKQRLDSGELLVERLVLPPVFFGYAETNTSEAFRPPTWTAAARRDEAGRAQGEGADGADPTGLVPAATPVEVRRGEPARNAPWRRLAGTDALGRDVFTRMLWGGRVSLAVGLAAATLLTLVGLVLGSVAGFVGGRVDFVVSRTIEVVLSIPALYLIVLAAAYVDPRALPPLTSIVLIIALVAWTGVARLVRAEMLRLRESEFVLAARSLGLPEWRVLLLHALPNALSPVLVAATFAVGGGILTESVVSYLGFGVQLPVPSWGALINGSRSAEHWWIQVLPGVAILLAVASFNLLGEALRDVLDPRAEGPGP